MRWSHFLTVLGGLFLAAAPLRAQAYPADMTISLPQVEVRSGPSMNFYPTSKLDYGSKVKVLRESKQPDWLEIEPPKESFSWINSKYVDVRPNGQMGTVIAEVPVPVLPGSSLVNKAPDVEQVKVKQGTQVLIVGPHLDAPGGRWLPIVPPTQEVRYIPKKAVQSAQLAATSPSTGAPVPGNLASLTRNQPASTPLKQPGYTGPTGQVPSYVGGWQAPNAPKTPGQATAMYANGSPQTPTPLYNPASWSVWGVLRRTAFRKEGQQMYVLENRQFQPLLYVSTQPGYSLSRYIGRTVSVFGILSYDSEHRIYTMTASAVALP